MDVHIRIRRWVLWWVYVSVVLGAVAIGSILSRTFTHEQIRMILFVGVVQWVLGGLMCYASDAVRVEPPSPPPPVPQNQVPKREPDREWHTASEFVFPGGRKSILPPRY